ncbi:hypothetical protein GGF40_003807 [Coemansia sp. RSA 1286]|nr:hypothetical protein GGF40_003807 [Coemansia sp. RSA 1286]
MTLVMTTVAHVTGLTLYGVATSFALCIVGRVLVGIGHGVATTIAPVYIGEISPKEHRGLFISFFTVGINFGMPVGFALAMAMQSNPNSSKWLFIFASALSLFVAILLLLLVPNSPRDLIYRGQLEKAKDVVKMLARPEMLSETEVSSQVRTLTKVIKSEAAPRFRDLFSRANRRSLAVACTLQVAKQVSGFNVLQSFSGYVFKIIGLAKGSTLQVPTILLGTVQLICAVASLGIVDILGRRKLLLLSTLVMAMGLVVLGGSFVMITGFDQIIKSRCEEYIRCGSCLLDTKCGWSAEADKCMLQQPPTMGSPVLLDSCPLSTTRERVGSWVAVCSFILSLGAMSLGLGSIPWIIQSEMFSQALRSKASGVASIFNWAFSYVSTVSFLQLAFAITMPGVFWLYAGLVVTTVLSVYWAIPETTGKTLEEISMLGAYRIYENRQHDDTKANDNSKAAQAEN